MERCYYPECTGEPIYICNCQNQVIKICLAHLDEHLAREDNHQINTNTIDISRGKKNIIISLLNKSLSKLLNMRSEVKDKAKENINKILNFTMKNLQWIKEQQMILSSTICYLNSKDFIVRRDSYNETENFIIANLESPHLLQHQFREKKEHMIREISLETNSDCHFPNILFNNVDGDVFESASIVTSLDISDEKFKKRSFHYFIENSKVFCSVDPFSNIDSKRTLEIEDNLSLHPGFCELPENKHFYYGGIVGTKDYTYIINCDDYTAVKMRGYRKKDRIDTCCYLDGWVFIFGGWHDRYLTESEKYNVNTNEWVSIADIPVGCYHNSTAIHNNDIIFAGKDIHRYNILTNSYSDPIGRFYNRDQVKFVFEANGFLYVYNEGRLYKSNDTACSQFTLIDMYAYPYHYGGTIVRHLPLCYPLRFGSGIYFVLSDYCIYRLDIETNKTVLIRRVRYPNNQSLNDLNL